MSDQPPSLQDKLSSAVEGFSGASQFRSKLDGLGVKVVADERLEERITVLKTLHEYLAEEDLDPTPERELKELETRFKVIDRVVRTVAIPWGRAGDRPTFAVVSLYYERMMARAQTKIGTVKELMTLRGGTYEEEAVSLSPPKPEKLTRKQRRAERRRKKKEAEEGKETQATKLTALQEVTNLLNIGPDGWQVVLPHGFTFGRRLVDKSELVRVLGNYLREDVFSRALFLTDLCFLEIDVLPSYTFTTQQTFFQMPGGGAAVTPGGHLPPGIDQPPGSKPLPEKLTE